MPDKLCCGYFPRPLNNSGRQVLLLNHLLDEETEYLVPILLLFTTVLHLNRLHHPCSNLMSYSKPAKAATHWRWCTYLIFPDSEHRTNSGATRSHPGPENFAVRTPKGPDKRGLVLHWASLIDSARHPWVLSGAQHTWSHAIPWYRPDCNQMPCFLARICDWLFFLNIPISGRTWLLRAGRTNPVGVGVGVWVSIRPRFPMSEFQMWKWS